MRNPLVPLLVTCSLTALGAAQKVVDSANETATVNFVSNAGDWFCIKRSLTAPQVLTALEFQLRSANATNLDFGVWDEDPVTAKPRTLLGSGTGTVTAGVPDWYGARFATPIVITTAGNYFTGVKLPPGVLLGLSTSGTITPHWWNPNSGWSGPHPSYAWPMRLYGGRHNGAYTNYGSGQAGSGQAVPAIRGLGWPNTTNTIGLQASQALGGQPGGYVFGPRATIPNPLGTLYAVPIIFVPVPMLGTGPGGGYATLQLTIPNDPSLNGGAVATQAWIADPGAATGFAHTGGLELSIGH